MTEIRKSNYSLFILSLLFLEFLSFLFRSNDLPNLGITTRMLIFTFLIVNAFTCMAIDILNRKFDSKIVASQLLFCVYTILVYISRDHTMRLVDVYNLVVWIAVFYLFYHYGFPVATDLFRVLIAAFVMLFILLYYTFALNSGFVGDKPGLVNTIYYIVMSIGLICFLKSNVLKLVLFAAIAIISVMSFKTTAILMVIVSLLIYFLFNTKGRRTDFIMIISGLFVFLLVVFIVLRTKDLDIKEIIALDIDTEGNGRIDIWNTVVTMYSKNPLYRKILGCGFEYPKRVSGYSAHCDFIEIFVSYGIIGFILFLRWFYPMMKFLIVKMRSDKKYYISLIVFAQIFLILTFSTTIFLPNYFLILLALVGMMLNEYENDKVSEKMDDEEENSSDDETEDKNEEEPTDDDDGEELGSIII